MKKGRPTSWPADQTIHRLLQLLAVNREESWSRPFGPASGQRRPVVTTPPPATALLPLPLPNSPWPSRQRAAGARRTRRLRRP